MTTEDALQSEPTAFEQTVFAERFEGILRACRRKTAGRTALEWGNADLIEFDKEHQWRDENLLRQLRNFKRSWDLFSGLSHEQILIQMPPEACAHEIRFYSESLRLQ